MTEVRDTSISAFEKDVLPTLSDRQKCVFELLEKNSDLTNSEIAARIGWPINCITPRIFELRAMKLVIDGGKRRCRVTGRTAHTWRLISNTLF